MTANSKKRIGTMACEGARCDSHAKNIPVVVFENAKGTLTYRCDYCGRTPYAQAGTDQQADWMKDIKLFQAKITPSAPVPVQKIEVVIDTSKSAPAAPEKTKSTKLVF